MAVHEAYILTNDVVLQWLPEQVIAAGDFDRVRARAERRGERGQARAVADYIAGMTDRYALDEHERLTSPKRLT